MCCAVFFADAIEEMGPFEKTKKNYTQFELDFACEKYLNPETERGMTGSVAHHLICNI